jgi:hypothetical protein
VQAEMELSLCAGRVGVVLGAEQHARRPRVEPAAHPGLPHPHPPRAAPGDGLSLSLARSLARSLSLVEPAALPGLPLPTPAMEGPGGTALSLVCNIHARSGYTSM